MKRNYVIITLCILVLGAVSAGCGKSDSDNKATSGTTETVFETESLTDKNSETTKKQDNKVAVSADNGLLGKFETTDWKGSPITQELFTESDVTMLNIWGTFCGPCISEMPELAELSDEYKGKMQVVGLVSDVIVPNDDTVKEIIEYTGADYLHILNSQDLNDGYLRQVQAVPTTVFLDREGKLIGKVYTGARDKEKWKKIIEEVLENR